MKNVPWQDKNKNSGLVSEPSPIMTSGQEMEQAYSYNPGAQHEVTISNEH